MPSPGRLDLQILENFFRGHLPFVQEPRSDELCPGVHLDAGFLLLSSLFDGNRPPILSGPEPEERLGKELFPIPSEAVEVDARTPDGPEATVPRPVLEVGILIGACNENALARIALRVPAVGEANVVFCGGNYGLDRFDLGATKT